MLVDKLIIRAVDSYFLLGLNLARMPITPTIHTVLENLPHNLQKLVLQDIKVNAPKILS